MHHNSWNHAHTDYVSHVDIDHKGAEFIGNKMTDSTTILR